MFDKNINNMTLKYWSNGFVHHLRHVFGTQHLSWNRMLIKIGCFSSIFVLNNRNKFSTIFMWYRSLLSSCGMSENAMVTIPNLCMGSSFSVGLISRRRTLLTTHISKWIFERATFRSTIIKAAIKICKCVLKSLLTMCQSTSWRLPRAQFNMMIGNFKSYIATWLLW